MSIHLFALLPEHTGDQSDFHSMCTFPTFEQCKWIFYYYTPYIAFSGKYISVSVATFSKAVT